MFVPSSGVVAGDGSRDCEPSRDEAAVEAGVVDCVEVGVEEPREGSVPDRSEEGVVDRVDGGADDDGVGGGGTGTVFWLGTTIAHRPSDVITASTTSLALRPPVGDFGVSL